VRVAYDPEQWHDLFVATAGAWAALLGVLIVAIVGLIPVESW
jgi:hypothetical protein